MLTYLIAISLILLMTIGWVTVQHLSRSFAAKHPEFGSPPEEGGRCGSCSCGGATACDNQNDS